MAKLLALFGLLSVLSLCYGNDWITAWGTSQAEAGPTLINEYPPFSPTPVITFPAKYFKNQTLRMIVHTTVSGNSFRVRFANKNAAPTNSSSPNTSVTIKEAWIGLQYLGTGIKPATDRLLTFNGKQSILISAGAEVTSDVISIRVVPQSDFSISMYILDPVPTGGGYAPRHPVAMQTSYIASAPGNFASDMSGAPFQNTTTEWFFITGVDATRPGWHTIAFIGDSIVEGFSLTPGTISGNKRITDYFGSRVMGNGKQYSVVNLGISGNELSFTPIPGIIPLGPNELARFDDLLNLPNIKYAITQGGINDIVLTLQCLNVYPNCSDPNVGSIIVNQTLSTLNQMSIKAHAKSVKLYCGTLIPDAGDGSPHNIIGVEAIRLAVNQAIRTQANCDAIIDFDAAVWDPTNHTRLNPPYDSGDHVHLTPLGYQTMSNTISLTLFT